jgi:hypothetical protein
MHPLYNKAHFYSGRVIGAAIEVHRLKGPDLIESIYEKCMMRELAWQNTPADVPLGLLINFHETALRNGITRLILEGADQP